MQTCAERSTQAGREGMGPFAVAVDGTAKQGK